MKDAETAVTDGEFPRVLRRIRLTIKREQRAVIGFVDLIEPNGKGTRLWHGGWNGRVKGAGASVQDQSIERVLVVGRTSGYLERAPRELGHIVGPGAIHRD